MFCNIRPLGYINLIQLSKYTYFKVQFISYFQPTDTTAPMSRGIDFSTSTPIKLENETVSNTFPHRQLRQAHQTRFQKYYLEHRTSSPH